MNVPSPRGIELLNRDHSILAFNERVLDWAYRADVPLLERLRFLGIVSSNFDEFFMVRTAAHEDQIALQNQIYEQAFALMHEQESFFQDKLLPQLESQLIRMLR